MNAAGKTKERVKNMLSKIGFYDLWIFWSKIMIKIVWDKINVKKLEI